jgi:hypothetical protein
VRLDGDGLTTCHVCVIYCSLQGTFVLLVVLLVKRRRLGGISEMPLLLLSVNNMYVFVISYFHDYLYASLVILT